MTTPDKGLINAVGVTMSDLHVIHVIAVAGGQTRYCIHPDRCKPESLARVNACVRKRLVEQRPDGDGWVQLRLTDLGRKAYEQQQAMLANAQKGVTA